MIDLRQMLVVPSARLYFDLELDDACNLAETLPPGVAQVTSGEAFWPKTL